MSGRVPKTALGAENGPGSIFRRLRLRFGGFFHVFSIVCWFAFRSSCFLRCTYRQRPNHTTIARDPPNDKRNAQVSLLQFARTTFTIDLTSCERRLCVRTRKRRWKKTHGLPVRLRGACSGVPALLLPALPPASDRRFNRHAKASAPSIYIYTYIHIYINPKEN